MGYDPAKITIEEIKEALPNEDLSRRFQDFFIYVGNFYPHKNVERLIKAFLKVKTRYRLILIGPDDYFTERIQKYIEGMNGKKGKVVLIKNPPTSDLVFFYKNAQAIIQPSLSEGFGLPLVEAAYFNCPIIASDIQVFRELWGNQYVSFDPKNTDDIANKINGFTIRKPKINYEEKLAKYSFKKMTEETLKIYFKI